MSTLLAHPSREFSHPRNTPQRLPVGILKSKVFICTVTERVCKSMTDGLFSKSNIVFQITEKNNSLVNK